jgi:hypothetical protein
MLEKTSIFTLGRRSAARPASRDGPASDTRTGWAPHRCASAVRAGPRHAEGPARPVVLDAPGEHGLAGREQGAGSGLALAGGERCPSYSMVSSGPVSGGRRRIPPFYPRRRGPAPGFGLVLDVAGGSTTRVACLPVAGSGTSPFPLIAGGPVGRRVVACAATALTRSVAGGTPGAVCESQSIRAVAGGLAAATFASRGRRIAVPRREEVPVPPHANGNDLDRGDRGHPQLHGWLCRGGLGASGSFQDAGHPSAARRANSSSRWRRERRRAGARVRGRPAARSPRPRAPSPARTGVPGTGRCCAATTRGLCFCTLF